MKHLMRYEGFSSQERQDEVLDKISKYGIASLTPEEKNFLDSYSSGEEEETHKKLNFHENEVIFEDDRGLFKFEFKSIKNFGDEKHICGVMYVPDLVWEDGSTLEGRLEGVIVSYGSGRSNLEFSVKVPDPKTKKMVSYDIFEFCNGIEYELDSFVDYVISEAESGF